MKLRLLKMVLFFPAVIIDAIFLGIIGFPLWLFCDIDPTSNNSIAQWLTELKNKK